MYVIVEQESHPDRFILDVFGPFDTYERAKEAEDELRKTRRLSWFHIREVEEIA